MDNTYKIKKRDGKEYTIRRDRHRYFFPDEWKKFSNSLDKKNHQLMFETLLFTGGRIMEVLHLKPSNLDLNRKTITFEIVKQRKAKKHFYSTGTKRTFNVQSKFLNRLKKYIVESKLDKNDYVFMDKKKLPTNYEELSNPEKKKYYSKHTSNYNKVLKRHLVQVKIEDYDNFSIHNLRKTYGNWMRVFDIKMEELCYNMGHDVETFMRHYGSALIFTDKERREIMRIMGD